MDCRGSCKSGTSVTPTPSCSTSSCTLEGQRWAACRLEMLMNYSRVQFITLITCHIAKSSFYSLQEICSLDQIFRPGMQVRCVVLKLDVTKGGSLSIKLSINPKLLNKALRSGMLKSGMVSWSPISPLCIPFHCSSAYPNRSMVSAHCSMQCIKHMLITHRCVNARRSVAVWRAWRTTGTWWTSALGKPRPSCPNRRPKTNKTTLKVRQRTAIIIS